MKATQLEEQRRGPALGGESGLQAGTSRCLTPGGLGPCREEPWARSRGICFNCQRRPPPPPLRGHTVTLPQHSVATRPYPELLLAVLATSPNPQPVCPWSPGASEEISVLTSIPVSHGGASGPRGRGEDSAGEVPPGLAHGQRVPGGRSSEEHRRPPPGLQAATCLRAERGLWAVGWPGRSVGGGAGVSMGASPLPTS